MKLALFDLDGTLIKDDSDRLWGKFLCEQSIYEEKEHYEKQAYFSNLYHQGKMNAQEYLAFSLRFFGLKDYKALLQLRELFYHSYLKDVILPKAEELVANVREDGFKVLLVTATNHFISEPLAKHFAVDAHLSTPIIMRDGYHSSEPTDNPCFREGKIKHFNAWLSSEALSPSEVHFYSDSMNDLPLLEQVDRPVAVDPCPRLREHALQNNWEVISLR